MSKNFKYIPGNPWAICDICGLAYRVSEMVENNDGYFVCRKDYDPYHPADYTRTYNDQETHEGPIRPEQTDSFKTVDNDTTLKGSLDTGTFGGNNGEL